MPKGQITSDFHFDGFESPNTTPVPDIIFDRFLSILKEAELKALLYIVRRTFGFKKDRDPISFNQFIRGITTRDGRVLDSGCGIKDRTTLSKALKSLEAMGIIASDKGIDERGENATTIYCLRFKTERPGMVVGISHHRSMDPPLPVVGDSYYPGMQSPPPVVGDSYPQDTGLQETDLQHTDQDLSRPRLTSNLHKKNHVYDEARLTLVEYVADLSAEFIDSASTESSTSRAVNLFRKSGFEMEAFIDAMTEARAITKERMASITKRTKDGDKTKMAYFFAVLEDRLGLKDDATDASERESQAANGKPRRGRVAQA